LQAQLAYYTRVLEWAESLSRPYPHLRESLAWLKAHRPPEPRPSLSWGDAKMGNCVFQGRRLAAMLDWEQATLADGVDDLAWWLMVDECLSSGTGAQRLAGLPTREATIARWETAAGRAASHLAYYEVFAAWRMACIMARIGTLFTARGWVPAEMQMDLNNGGASLLARHGQRLGFAAAPTASRNLT
jgi:aminoglycoside phosphotransferase (APT) family kinase protein